MNPIAPTTRDHWTTTIPHPLKGKSLREEPLTDAEADEYVLATYPGWALASPTVQGRDRRGVPVLCINLRRVGTEPAPFETDTPRFVAELQR